MFKEDEFKAVLVIDAQYDFMDSGGALFVPGSNVITPILNEYLESLSLENGYIGVLFTADTHSPETYPGSPEAEQFPPHCYTGTDGFNFAVEPQRVPKETPKFILNKGVFNMWEESGLLVRPLKSEGEVAAVGGEQKREAFFKNLTSAGVEDIEVVGVAADYCVKWAVQGLLDRGFAVTLYDNLTAGIERDIHEVVKDDFEGNKIRVL